MSAETLTRGLWPKCENDLLTLVTSKTHLILRALGSTYTLYLTIPVSGVLKLKLRTDAQTDGAKR